MLSVFRLLGCGAYHVAMAGKILVLEDMTRVPVEISTSLPSSVIVTHSGEKFTGCHHYPERLQTVWQPLRLAKEKGVGVLGVVKNVVGSSIARESDHTRTYAREMEISVATTKAYSTQLIADVSVCNALWTGKVCCVAKEDCTKMIAELNDFRAKFIFWMILQRSKCKRHVLSGTWSGLCYSSLR